MSSFTNGDLTAAAHQLTYRMTLTDEIHYGPGYEPNEHKHTAFTPKTTPMARVRQNFTPTSGQIQPGATSRVEIAACGAYAHKIAFHAQMASITTSGTAFSEVNHVLPCDNFGHAIIDEVRYLVGCGGTQLPPYTGAILKIMYDRQADHTRAAAMVFDMNPTDRVEANAHQTITLTVDLPIGPLSHASYAPYLSAYQNSTLAIELKLRRIEECVSRAGTYAAAGVDGTGATVVAGAQFGNETIPSTFQESVIMTELSFLTEDDQKALVRRGEIRRLPVRSFERVTQSHAGAASLSIPIPIITNIDQIIVVPRYNAIQLGRTTGFNGFNFAGLNDPRLQTGPGWVQGRPFAGMELLLNGRVLYSASYQDATSWSAALAAFRVPVDKTEKVAVYDFDTHAAIMHDAHLGAGAQQSVAIRLLWNYNGTTVPNGNAEIDVYLRRIGFHVEDIVSGKTRLLD